MYYRTITVKIYVEKIEKRVQHNINHSFVKWRREHTKTREVLKSHIKMRKHTSKLLATEMHLYWKSRVISYTNQLFKLDGLWPASTWIYFVLNSEVWQQVREIQDKCNMRLLHLVRKPMAKYNHCHLSCPMNLCLNFMQKKTFWFFRVYIDMAAWVDNTIYLTIASVHICRYCVQLKILNIQSKIVRAVKDVRLQHKLMDHTVT